jgi:hypothetical protein
MLVFAMVILLYRNSIALRRIVRIKKRLWQRTITAFAIPGNTQRELTQAVLHIIIAVCREIFTDPPSFVFFYILTVFAPIVKRNPPETAGKGVFVLSFAI